jgi:hypothetical protein
MFDLKVVFDVKMAVWVLKTNFAEKGGSKSQNV